MIWDLIVGGAAVLGGVYFIAASKGKVNHSEANAEYWSRLHQQQPFLMKYMPPFIIAFGVFRLVTAFA